MPKLTGGATTAEHKIATREAMLDAFIRELREQGWQNVKLQTVAQAAGVSRTAVYNYFPDKSALLLAWSTREMDRFLLLAERELADRENPVDRLEILVKLTLVEFSLQRFTGIALVELLSAQDRESFLEHIVPAVGSGRTARPGRCRRRCLCRFRCCRIRATHPRLRGKPTPDAHGRRPSGRRRSDHRPVHHARVGRCVADFPRGRTLRSLCSRSVGSQICISTSRPSISRPSD